MNYEVDIAGYKKSLKLFKVSDDLQIAAFILYGDVAVTQHAAKELLARAPEFDIMLTSASKSSTLIFEFGSEEGVNYYFVALKAQLVYMGEPLSADVNSITTFQRQKIFIGEDDVEKMRGKRVLIVDDVISTGQSLAALEKIAEGAGGNIVGKMAVLAEGDAYDRTDITVLGKLPLFDTEGNVL